MVFKNLLHGAFYRNTAHISFSGFPPHPKKEFPFEPSTTNYVVTQ